MRFFTSLAAAALLAGPAAAAPISLGALSTRAETKLTVTFHGAPPSVFYNRDVVANGVPMKITGEKLSISSITAGGNIKISCSVKTAGTPPRTQSFAGGSVSRYLQLLSFE